ncbi:hypothetical protein KAU19_06265, partial [Candidatus Parcubacteria bacterium]|nr:hypothetical protein [Candidatus Parcubacteria bacterium]
IDVLYIQVDYTIHNITTGTGETQTTNMDVDSSDNYVGGYFTFVRDAGTANVTQIVISETGTVNANSNLSNVDIYYETAESCSYDADEALFGTAASFDASENATISGTMAVGTSQICVYVVLDVGSGASADETVLIEITNPSSEVTASVGTVSPGTAVVINGATTLQASSNSAPSITSISLNGGNNINLNEGTFKWATSTIAITDSEGCDTISSVAAKLYRTATSTNGTTCSQNDLNCYIGVGSTTAANNCIATTTGDTCGESDNTVEYDCGFKIWYIADPTDMGAYAGDIWAVAATTTDSGSLTGTATNTGQTVEIISQNALSVTSSINYGELDPDTNTSSNQETTVTTTGNTAIDVELFGIDLSDNGNAIDVGKQKYDIINQADYADLTYTLTLSNEHLEIANTKPTSTTTPPSDIVYWGLNVPAGTPVGSYSGTNTFGAVSN